MLRKAKVDFGLGHIQLVCQYIPSILICIFSMLQDIQEALQASQMAAAAAAEEVMTLQGKHAHSLAQLSAANKELSNYKLQVEPGHRPISKKFWRTQHSKHTV